MDTAADAWHRWGSTLANWLGPVTEAMLDIAAGAGEQTLKAARRVGPTGHVLATDISAKILEFAAAVANDAGFTNDAVTRNQKGQRVAADRRADRAGRRRSFHRRCEASVTDHRAGRHAKQRTPDAELEGRRADEGAEVDHGGVRAGGPEDLRTQGAG